MVEIGDIWEGSAAADVWLHPGDYLDFRKYALSGLSDLGFLDRLLDLFADTLRVISGVGGKTLMTCIVVTAADRLRAQRADRRGRRSRSQGAGASDEEEKSDEPAQFSKLGLSLWKDVVITSFFRFVFQVLESFASILTIT